MRLGLTHPHRPSPAVRLLLGREHRIDGLAERPTLAVLPRGRLKHPVRRTRHLITFNTSINTSEINPTAPASTHLRTSRSVGISISITRNR